MLRKCCCCSLRTGAFIVGYSDIVTTLFLFPFVAVIVQLSSGTDIHEKLKIAMGVVLTVLCVVELVNTLMVYGLHQGKPGFLIPWLVLSFIGFVVFSILVTILSGIVLRRGANGFEYFIIFVVMPLTLALSFYLYSVVFSHYKELCNGPSYSRPRNETNDALMTRLSL